MLISELFYTLQGEGTYIGVPSVFIRTSGCNLKCSFCDSPYTSWYIEGDNKQSNELINEINSKWPNCNHVVISGGEPLIQKDLIEVVNLLKENNKIITIETNGTIFKHDIIPDLFSISPKLSNSIPHTKEKYKKTHIQNNNLEKLEKYINCGINYQIKFVVKDKTDLDEIVELEKKYSIPKDKIFLMPEGIDKEIIRKRYIILSELCKQYGYILCPRLHIEIWGSKRGT